jgi:hypothetical protein
VKHALRTAAGRLRRRLFATAWCALVCGAAAASPGTGAHFQVITADDSSVTRRIADDLTKRLAPLFAGPRAELVQVRPTLLVTIGPVALRDAAALKCHCVVIAAYTSSQVWRLVTAGLPATRKMAMTAIYAEPSPVDQVRLISLLYRRPVRVAAIVSHDTSYLKPIMLDTGSVEIEDYAEGDDINYALNRVGQAQVLLAMPDRTVYSTENFRNILLSTYRHNQAVIGFSADMVRAGALATTYSNPEHINAHIAELANDFILTGELAAPQFPRYFRTTINEGVARSLQVAISEEARKFGREPHLRRP